MIDILKELGIEHKTVEVPCGSHPNCEFELVCENDCPACAVLKAKPLLIDEGKRQMIDEIEKNSHYEEPPMFPQPSTEYNRWRVMENDYWEALKKEDIK